MQISYLCASEFPLKNFCKHAKQAKTIRNGSTVNQGHVGSYPAQGVKSFSSNENVIQKLSVLGSFINFTN